MSPRFVVVAVVAKAAIVGIGLPDWVFPGAHRRHGARPAGHRSFTAYVQRTARRAFTVTPTLTPGGSTAPQGTLATMAIKAAPHVSWRRTTLGGVYAGVAFIALIGGLHAPSRVRHRARRLAHGRRQVRRARGHHPHRLQGPCHRLPARADRYRGVPHRSGAIVEPARHARQYRAGGALADATARPEPASTTTSRARSPRGRA